MYTDIELPRPSSGLLSATFSYGHPSKIYHQLEHDKSIKYSVPIGKPAASSDITAARRFGTTITNSRVHTPPPRPPRDEDPDKTPTPFKRNVQLQPLDDHPDVSGRDPSARQPASSATPSTPPKIQPVVLHPALQLYYLQMQQSIRQTSHPKVISAEASRIASILIYAPTSSPDLDLTPHKKSGRSFTWEGNAIQDVTTKLIIAGIADMHYVRSMALLAHDIVMELMWKDSQSKKALEFSLIDQAMVTFNNGWGPQTSHSMLASETGLDHHCGVPLGFQTVRSQVMNTSAFIGSLFAVGLLPFEKFEDCASSLLQHASDLMNIDDGMCRSSHSVVCLYLRGLYLLLLHATTGCIAVHSKQIGFLSHLRDILVSFGAGISSGDFAFKVMERRWLIETCNVLDAALNFAASRRSTYATATARYRWNPSLQWSSLFEFSEGCSIFTPSLDF